jgi:pilus assembly protein FimV
VLAGKPNSDPKWQEVATKLDLAKAYEEMGDKDGARELLKEVVKDGDAAQRGTAEALLAKLG